MSIPSRLRHPAEPDLADEMRKTEVAIRELERAELYVVSAINLELADGGLRRALQLLHGQLLEVHELLRKPRVAT